MKETRDIGGEGPVPDRRACFELLRSFCVPEHIIRHCKQVHRVALCLATGLNEKGEGLEIEVIEAAALLHDITKMESLRTGKNHARTGAELLRGLGYIRIGDVVEHHIVLPEDRSSAAVTEEEIVNYSDKRVMHDRIVMLEDRFQDILNRYGHSEESRALMEVWKARALRLEGKIFSKLHFGPEFLLGL